MSKKNDIDNKIESEFGELIGGLKNYYKERESSDIALQGIGVKLNEKIEGYKPSFWEKIKLFYGNNKTIYNVAFTFFFVVFGAVIAAVYLYPTSQIIPGIPSLKTKVIPEVALSKENDSEIGVDTITKFTIAAKENINRVTFEENVRIEPEIDYTVNWISDTEVEVIPTDELDIETEYKVVLGVGTQFGEEEPILDDLVWNFRTRPVFAISGITPVNNSTDAPADTAIEVEFNYNNINKESFEQNFSIEPEVEGHFELSGKKVIFLPNEPLNPTIEYTVKIAGGVQNSFSETLNKESSVSFSTTGQKKDGSYVDYPNIYCSGLYENTFHTNILDNIECNSQRIWTPITVEVYSLDKNNLIALWTDESAFDFDQLSDPVFEQNYNATSSNETWSFDIDLSGLEKNLYLARIYSEESGIYLNRVIDYTDYAIYYSVGIDDSRIWAFDLANKALITSGNVSFYEMTDTGISEVGKENLDESGEIITTKSFQLLIAEIDGKIIPVREDESSDWYNNYWYSGANTESEYRAYTYFDRPLYKPGDKVYFKGIVRKEKDLQYELPKNGTEVKVVVPNGYGNYSYNWQGVEKVSNIFEETFTIDNNFGTFSGEFTVPEDMIDDFLSIKTYVDEKLAGTTSGAYVTPYSKAQYEINVSANKDEYISGETMTVSAKAQRYSGEPYSGQATARIFMNNIYAGIYWPDEEFLSGYKTPGSYYYHETNVYEEILSFDENGELSFSYVTDYVNEEYNVGMYTIEVEIDNNTDVGFVEKTSAIVYEEDVDIFAQTDSYSNFAGDTINIEVGTFLSGTDTAKEGIPFTMNIERQWSEKVETGTRYNSRTKTVEKVYDYVSHTEDAGSITGITDESGRYDYSYEIPAHGSYSIEFLMGSNEKEHSLFYADEQADSYSYQKYTVSITASESSPNIGDEIELKISSDLEEGESLEAILIAARGNIYESEKITIGSEDLILKKEIKDNYSPKVEYRLIYPNEKYRDDIPYLVLETTSKTVTPQNTETLLQIDISSNKENYMPGEEVTLNVDVTDEQGNGAESEVSLSLIDKSLLNIMNYHFNDDIHTVFYETIRHYISSYATLKDDFGGGGGGGDGDIRSEFEDTAYWNAHVVTDKNGNAEVKFTLPDNLTTWAITSKAITKDTKVGQAVDEIKVRKDTHIDYILPLFLRERDKITLPVKISNNSGANLGGKLRIEADGAEITSETEYDVNINNGQTNYVNFTMAIGGKDEVDLTVSLIGNDGNAIDMVKKSATIIPLTTTVVTKKGMEIDGENNEYSFEISENAILEKSNYQMYLSGSILSGILSPTGYIGNSANDAAGVLLKNMELLSRGYDQNTEEMVAQSKLAIEALEKKQSSDGGYGWFGYDASNIYTSSYVYIALSKAKSAGFEINETILNNLEVYINGNLSSEETGLQDKALLLYASSESGSKEYLPFATYMAAQIDDFYESPSTLAYLSMALYNYGSTGDAISLVSQIVDLAELNGTWAHWIEPESEDKDTISNLEVTAIAYDMLARYNKPLADNAKNYLIENSDYYNQEISKYIKIISLIRHETDFDMSLPEDLKVYVNNQEVSINTSNDERAVIELPYEALNTGNNLIRFEFTEGSIYMELLSEEALPLQDAANSGIETSILFKNLESGEVTNNYEIGEAIVMEMKIISATNMKYTNVMGAIPAGTEIIKTAVSYTSASVIQAFYEKAWKAHATTWGERELDKQTFSQYYLEAGKEYVFQIPLIAAQKGSFSVPGAYAYGANEPEINGRSGNLVITIE